MGLWVEKLSFPRTQMASSNSIQHISPKVDFAVPNLFPTFVIGFGLWQEPFPEETVGYVKLYPQNTPRRISLPKPSPAGFLFLMGFGKTITHTGRVHPKGFHLGTPEAAPLGDPLEDERGLPYRQIKVSPRTAALGPHARLADPIIQDGGILPTELADAHGGLQIGYIRHN